MQKPGRLLLFSMADKLHRWKAQTLTLFIMMSKSDVAAEFRCHPLDVKSVHIYERFAVP